MGNKNSQKEKKEVGRGGRPASWVNSIVPQLVPPALEIAFCTYI